MKIKTVRKVTQTPRYVTTIPSDLYHKWTSKQAVRIGEVRKIFEDARLSEELSELRVHLDLSMREASALAAALTVYDLDVYETEEDTRDSLKQCMNTLESYLSHQLTKYAPHDLRSDGSTEFGALGDMLIHTKLSKDVPMISQTLSSLKDYKDDE